VRGGGTGTGLQWGLRGGGVGVLEPWASSDILGKSWKILGESRARRKILGVILGDSGIFASSESIVRGCNNHAPRTVS
jgi:hypothetical protein